MGLDDQTNSLIFAAKQGNIEALNKLFATYQSRILRIVRLRLAPGLRQKLKLQSMDIVQEVLMYAFQHLEAFEPKSQGHFLNWLSKKVEHYICDRLDFVSRIKREAPGGETSIDHGIDTELGEAKIQIKDDRPTPSQFAVNKDSEALVDSLLDFLDPEEKELIINRLLEELTFAEIGEQLGKSEDAARKQYNRAFKKLIDLGEDRIRLLLADQTYKELKNGL